MAKMDVQRVLKFAEDLFSAQVHMVPQWQTLADNFYPERADFKFGGNGLMRGEIADTLADSYPVLVRRDLANSFHAMLRDGRWFELTTQQEGDFRYDSKAWLEWATNRQYEFMHQRSSGFIRAVKEGDHDYATFGNTVISVMPNRTRDGIVYQTWHIRDCAWQDDETGQVSSVARRWTPTRFSLVRHFGKENLHHNVLKKLDKEPFGEESFYHVVVPSDLYGDEEIQETYPYVSLYIDRNNQYIVEEQPLFQKVYVIPRFQTIAGSPYAYSPATMAGLPDARTLQAMTHTLLESAERYARPPILATQKAVTGVVDLSPDGITWVDNEYDERLGASMRPMTQDRGGYPIGNNERTRVYDILSRAFFLDRLFLPMGDKEMTAYEVQERMKEFRRQNLPLFAPMEDDYNGQLCEMTFDLMMQMGLLGSPQDIPAELQGEDVKFKFKSPLSETEEEQRVNRFNQLNQLLAGAAEMDQQVIDNVDFDQSLRDAIEGLKAPQRWLQPPEAVQQIRQQRARIAAAQEMDEAEQSGTGGGGSRRGQQAA